MLPINEIVDALTCTRSEFDKLFLQAQTVVGIPVVERRAFESLVTDIPDDKQAFAKALFEGNKAAEVWRFEKAKRLAAEGKPPELENNRFLFNFVSQIVLAGLEDGRLTNYLLANSRGADTGLQAMSNPPAGFTDPLIHGKGIIKTTQLAGKVLLGGRDMGTGVLVGPNLFLTAWHVLQDMFSLDGYGIYKPLEKPPMLEVEFNDLIDMMDNRSIPTQPLRVKAHADWLVCYSPCHVSELIAQMANPLKSLEGYYDYAIVRLSGAVGMVRRWVKPDPRIPVPQPSDRIVLFQHPAGVPLKIDYSTIVDPEVPDEAIPTLRFLHRVNSVGGSSGGPCFDKEFALVGIHQGEWPVKIGGCTINRGIPMAKIIAHYKEKLNELPLPDPADCPVWYIKKDVYKAVIGCDEFQSQVWRSAITGAHRIISINGYPKTGKSFLVELATAILPDADHLKIVLAAASIAQKPALGIARDICSLAGVAFPDIASMASYNSTSGAWLKDEVIPKLVEALELKRRGRMVWIALTDLNIHNIEGEHASDFLLLLYGQTAQKNWLRIILDGLSTALPSGLTGVYPHPTATITEADIKTFMERGFAELGADAGLATAAANARFLLQRYNEAVVAKDEQALKRLAGDSMAMVMAYKQQNLNV
jgi:hypothetical protein